MKSKAPFQVGRGALFVLGLFSAGSSADTVLMQKQDTGYAIDGNNGTSQEEEQVYLWTTDADNVNQQWIEISQGDSYYSYQKQDTSLCLDGGDGGDLRQPITLEICDDSDYNQHWLKVYVSGDSYRLEKRNASDYSIDGNNGADLRQGIYLWESDSDNVNQQWEFWVLEEDAESPPDRSEWTLDASDNTAALDNALDGDDDSRWTTQAVQNDSQWLTIDLGRESSFNTLTLVSDESPNDYPRGYLVYVSSDGSDWGSAVASGSGSDSTTVIDLDDTVAQYIKIEQTGSSDNYWWSIHELYVTEEAQTETVEVEGPPDRSEWLLDASDKSSEVDSAIDGDEDTRWDTGTQQAIGQWLTIDMGREASFNTITLDTDNSADDFARTYEVYVSDDGENWGSAVADGGSASSTTVIEFEDVTAQHIKIVNTGRAQGYWWSIHELYVSSEETLDESTCISVDSLTELASYTDVSDTCVVMEPGTYEYNTSNSGSDQEFSDPTLLEFTGDNNTFFFDDVKFEYDTDIFTEFGSVEVLQFHVSGDNNAFYNLTMEDIGDTTPSSTALAMKLDGSDNLIEGFTVTTRGSYPYGYGDIFGKSSGSVIGHRKHGGVHFRGTRNHLKDTNLYLRSYGHGIYIQGATDALIEGIYMEGELRTTDEVLAEYSTGTPADDVDFMTIWGYRLEPGWTFSLQEDGIRAYGSGEDYETGETNITGNVTVIDSTVKYMRAGVTIGWAYGHKYAQNCTSLAVESGFWMGSNADVVDSRGDSSVGPLYSEDAERSGSDIELTLLDNEIEKWGETPTFYLAGSDHDVTIYDGTSEFDQEFEIMVAGTRYGHRWLEGSDEEPPHKDADNIILDNQSAYPVALGDNATESDVTSCGDVADYGTDNSVENDCGSTTEISSYDCQLETPYDLSVNYINGTSAILYWEDDSENLSHYDLRYSKTGTEDWTTETVVASQRATQLIELSSGTSYDWQIRANCDDGSSSEYSDTDGSFTTE